LNLYLATFGGLGIDDLLDVEDRDKWASQQRGPSVNNSLAAAITSNNLPLHGDAKRQGAKQTPGSLYSISIPHCLRNSPSVKLPPCFPLL
jgi:hypothetical protein